MEALRRLPMPLLAALIFCFAHSAGCRVPPEPAAAPMAPATEAEAQVGAAPEPAPPSAPDLFQMAVKAYGDRDCERSRELFQQALESPEALTDQQAADAQAHLARIQSIMHQRELEAKQRAAEAAGTAAPAPAPVPMAEPEAAGTAAPAPAPVLMAEPEAVPLQASALLARARSLADEKKFAEAAMSVEVLDGLREHLGPEERAHFDLLRVTVQKATRRLRPLTSDEEEARARDDFGSGIKSYEAKDYGAAGPELDAAASFGVSLGWWDNRKLRNVQEEVEQALGSLRADVAGARALFEAGEYARAQELLAKVKGTGINIGEAEGDEVDRLLAEVTPRLSAQELREAEERRDLAAGRLDKAKALVAQQDFAAAGGELTELAAIARYLSDEGRQEFQGLCDEVEKATGVRPGMSPEEKLAKARQHFERGMAAYYENRFVEAQTYLRRAAEMKVDLGSADNRKLLRTADRVDEALGRLRAQYESGRELFQASDYAGARSALRAVKDSGIELGPQETAEVDRLLERIKQKVEEQRQREADEQAERARTLLAAAESLAGERKYPEAQAKLAQLERLTGRLSPERQAEARRLSAEVEAAAKAASVKAADEEARRLAARSAALLEAQRNVLAAMRSAEEALRAGDPEGAKALLLRVQEMLGQPEVADLPALREARAQLGRRMAIADAAVAEKARLAGVRQRLGAMLREAVALSQTDLPAAEAKALEAGQLSAQEGMELTPEQAQARDAVLGAVEARYGAGRRLRRQLYAALVDLGDRYVEAGEPEKARQVLLLVQEAPARAAMDEDRDAARRKLIAVQSEIARQEAAVQRVAGMLRECDAALRQGQLPQALKQVDAILKAAEDEKLGSASLARVLTETVSFLTQDFDGAVRTAYPSAEQLVDEQLGRARLIVAGELSRLYLGKDGPELAEPYLEQLAAAAAADPESSAWAHERLRGIEDLKLHAEQRRLLAIEEDAKKMLALAARFHEAARAGQVAEAQAAEQELADARLALQAKKAQAAVARGAYDEAGRLLQDVQLEKASAATVEQTYQPVLAQVKGLQLAAATLQAAEEALVAHNLADAGARLAEVQATGADAAPVVIRKELVAGVLNAALELQETVTGLNAHQARILTQAHGKLAAFDVRERAWQAYCAALEAFLVGREGGRAALGRLVAEPQGLSRFELDAVQAVVEPPPQPKPVASEAQQVLGQALAAYGERDYLKAQALLDELSGAPESAADKALQRDAGQLADLIRQQEAHAQRLYDEAAKAYKAGQADRMRALMGELRKDYGRTKVYRDHM